MARLDLPATKSNLLRLKEDLLLAREGRELLDEKREIILREIFSHLEDLRRSRKELDTALSEAYSALAEACIAIGREGAARAALAALPPDEISMHERSVIGVIVPLLEWKSKDEPPRWGLLDTSLELDAAREKFLVPSSAWSLWQSSRSPFAAWRPNCARPRNGSTRFRIF